MTKKDILELKRRLKKDDCTFTRLCGCYVDSQKNILLHLNETFLNLDEDSFYKYLEIAKKALPATVGNNLLELSFLPEEDGAEAQKFFLALRDSGLRSEALLDVLYERIIRAYDHAGNYLILLFHDAYDVMTKTSDNRKLDESEEVYEYLLCAICPVDLTKAGLGYHKDKNIIAPRVRDWVVSAPESGFLFPAFSERSSDVNAMGYFVRDAKKAQPDFMRDALGCEPKRTAAVEKKTFHAILQEALAPETEDAATVILDIQQELNDRAEEHKTVFEQEPLVLTAPVLQEALAEQGVSPEVIAKVEDAYTAEFGDALPPAENLIDKKALQARADAKKAAALQQQVDALQQKLQAQQPAEPAEKEIILQVPPEKLAAVKTETLDGKTCIVIPLEADEHAIINGTDWNDAPF